jgi:hypothetical protein
MLADIEIQVESYAGYRADQTPRRFSLGKRSIEVAEVIDQWYGPDYRYFKLKGDDGGIYILRQDEKQHHWELIMFDAGACDETRLSSS